MRVLLATDWPGFGGGMETYFGMLTKGLQQAGDDVRLLTSSVGGGARVAQYVAFGARHPALQSVLQIANPAATLAVRRAVSEFNPDVAVVGMFEMHLSPSVLAALRGVPTVLSVAYYKPICPNGLKLLPNNSLCEVQQGAICWRGGCTSLAHWLRDRLRYARIAREIAAVSRVTTCSRYLQQELASAGIASRFHPWPIEAASPSFLRKLADEPLFVFTGRLAREKGVDILFEALARLRADRVPARLRVVGDGPHRSRLEALATSLGVESAVEFTGWLPLDQVESQLADAWALVAPSRWAEPLGLTALEAVVRGLPAVVSRIGGLSETVEEGVSGLLFPNGDVAALAQCLSDISSGRVFSGGVSPAVAGAIQARHDLGAHVTWIRNLLLEIAA